MKITAQEEYGLRCLLQLAQHDRDDQPLTVAVISEREGLSGPYVAKLMGALRQAGLVQSVRGRTGGFVLSRPPGEITVGDALNGLGGHLFESGFCESHHGTTEECVHLNRCSIRTLWGVLGRIIDQVLERTTLADLADQDRPCESLNISEEEIAKLIHAGSGKRSEPIPLRAAAARDPKKESV